MTLGKNSKYFTDRHHRCSVCKSFVRHKLKYDAYYCKECNEWLEGKCEDKECDFCVGRPVKPWRK